MIKKIIYVLVALLVLIQLFQIDKTQTVDNPQDITNKYQTSSEVEKLLKFACYDCHSNITRYPWYASIQPIGWWLNSHIQEGKEHLNFSTFGDRRMAVQNHKFEEIIEMVKEKKMPIPSYTWFGMHPEANLTLDQRSAITSWAQMQMDLIARSFPADSLKMERRKVEREEESEEKKRDR